MFWHQLRFPAACYENVSAAHQGVERSRTVANLPRPQAGA